VSQTQFWIHVSEQLDELLQQQDECLLNQSPEVQRAGEIEIGVSSVTRTVAVRELFVMQDILGNLVMVG